MKKLTLLLLQVLLLSACGAITTIEKEPYGPSDGLEATVEVHATWLSYLSTRDGASRGLETTVEALAAQNAYLSTALAAQSALSTPQQITTPTPWVKSAWVYPPGVQTGIPQVDAVIDAVLAKDTETLREMIRYMSFNCTTTDGLGGPPKCAPGETDGTPVQAFPIAGVEGHYDRPETIDGTLEFITNVQGLTAVYRVTEDSYEAGWPVGQYAIVFYQDQGERGPMTITLRVEDGWIVRLDYQFIRPPDEEVERAGGEVILPPTR